MTILIGMSTYENFLGGIILLGGLTYVILPQIMLTFLTTVKAVDYLKDTLVKYISVPSLDAINMVLSAMGVAQITPSQVALFIVQALIIIVTIQLLLPLRGICMCLWYKTYCNDNDVVKKVDQKFMNRVNKEVKRRKKYKD